MPPKFDGLSKGPQNIYQYIFSNGGPKKTSLKSNMILWEVSPNIELMVL